MKKMNKKGFTIVELVIVIAVIAILAAVLIPTFSGVVARANASAAQQAALSGVKASLLMTATAALPADTLVFVNVAKKPTAPEVAYLYDGNALSSNPVDNLTKENKFNSNELVKNIKKFSLIVNVAVVENPDAQVGSNALSPDGMLKQLIKFIAGDNATGSNALTSSGIAVGSTANWQVEGASIYSVQVKESGADAYYVVYCGDYTFSVYMSSDIPKNVFVLVPDTSTNS